MNITQVTRGRATKVVHFEDVTTETDADLIAAACKAVGEARTSLFGTSVSRDFLDGDHAAVDLWTD